MLAVQYCQFCRKACLLGSKAFNRRVERNLGVSEKVYWIARTAVTKYHRLGGSTNRNLVFHGYGDWKSKIKVLASLVSPEPTLLGLLMATFSLCPHIVFLFAHTSLVCLSSWMDPKNPMLPKKRTQHSEAYSSISFLQCKSICPQGA